MILNDNNLDSPSGLTRDVSDVNKRVVERGEDVRHAEHVLTLLGRGTRALLPSSFPFIPPVTRTIVSRPAINMCKQ